MIAWLFQFLHWFSHGCQTLLERAHSIETENSPFYAHADHCRPRWLWPEVVLGTLWSHLTQHQLHLHCWWTRVQMCIMSPSVGWRDLWYLPHRSVTRINLIHVWMILSVHCGTWVFNNILPMVTMWADWLWTHYLVFVFTVIFLFYFFFIKFCWSIVASQAAWEEPACQYRRPKRHGFDSWVRKIPWRRHMQTHFRILVWRIPMDRGAWWAIDHWVTESDPTEVI